MTFEAGNDACLGFWAHAWTHGVVTFPPHAQVLEVGCAEADWIGPMLQERPDLQITAIDWRDSDRKAALTIKGDVLQQSFAPASFDAVVAVSTLEHIGLGSYDGDPIDADGDLKAVDRIVTWLKPGGWLYFDVPYRPNGPYVVTHNFRAYDEGELQKRLLRPGLTERWRSAQSTGHPDGPYLCVVCDRA